MSADIILPYAKCIPVQLTGFATAPLALGAYNFTTLGKINLSPAFNFLDNAVYVLTDITFWTNVEEAGWINGLGDPAPKLQFYMSGKDSSPLLEYPIAVPKYFQQYEYIKMFYPKVSPNSLSFSITGTVSQNIYSAGIPALVAGIMATLYEVKDADFVTKHGRNI